MARNPRWESGTGVHARPRQIGDGDGDGPPIPGKSGTMGPGCDGGASLIMISANRPGGWGCQWGRTPDPRRIGDGSPIHTPGQIGERTGIGDSAPCVTQHTGSPPNDELKKPLCHDTSDPESVPKNGQVQLPSRAHARAAFAALTIGSINHPLRSMALSPRCRTPVAMQIVEHMSADSHRALLLVVWCAISGLCAVRGSWGCS
jgi:hypothetical protein